MLELHLRLAGWACLLLAAVYPVYPRRFGWREKLGRVDLLIRDIFVVHVGFIVLLLALQGVLLAFFPGVLLVPGGAAAALAVGLVAFWGYRLFAQLFLFDRRHWRGDRLHTAVHVAFTLLWAYLTAVSAWALAAAL
jgi:hypothetical protein